MKKYKVKVLALWFQPEIGLKGYYGAVLEDGTPVALCSQEKWELGRKDSLRTGWEKNTKVFDFPKAIHINIPESELRKNGMKVGQVNLTIPKEFK